MLGPGGEADPALLLITYHDPLEEQLHHRPKIEAIGQLAAGTAHDLNNVLEEILANLRHLEGLAAETALGSSEVLQCAVWGFSDRGRRSPDRCRPTMQA